MCGVKNGMYLKKSQKEGEEMKKKRMAISFFIGIIISLVLIIDPIKSCATSTTMTITFSSQEREREGESTTDLPLIKHTREKKRDESFLAYSGQRRLPTTGEEYNSVLSCLGWTTFLFTLLFFFIGNYERRRRDGCE